MFFNVKRKKFTLNIDTSRLKVLIIGKLGISTCIELRVFSAYLVKIFLSMFPAF